MDSTFMLMDILIIGTGLYVLYLSYTTKKEGKLKESMLLPKNLNPKKCKDQKAYIEYITGKQYILSAIVVFCGLIGLIQDYTHAIGAYTYLACMVVVIAAIIWYGVLSRNAIKRFW